jgi:DNA repair exonuclease SbcCD ATPase subunit
MTPIKLKTILSVALFLICLSSYSQIDEKKNSDAKDVKDVKTEKNSKEDSSKEKPCVSDDPKKPIVKKDLEPLTKEIESLKAEITILKSTLDGLPQIINTQYTKLDELQNSQNELTKRNAELEEQKKSAESSLNVEKGFTKKAEEERNKLESDKNDYYESLNTMVLDFVKNCKNPDILTIENLKKQLSKSGMFLPTGKTLSRFSEMANNLNSAANLLTKSVITDAEFLNTKKILNDIIMNTEFIGLQESAVALKLNYDRFVELATKLETTILEDKDINDLEYRSKVFPEDFRPYIFALNPYPFLVSKYKEALKNPNCKLGITLK